MSRARGANAAERQTRAGGQPLRRRPTYRSLETEPSYEHPVDRTARLRVKRRDLQRAIAGASTEIVKALGKRRRLWFRFEAAADELRALREAAFFDVGVEQGIAAAAVHGLGNPSKHVRALAQRVVRELRTTGVARHVALGVALVAAWALLPRADSGARSARHRGRTMPQGTPRAQLSRSATG